MDCLKGNYVMMMMIMMMIMRKYCNHRAVRDQTMERFSLNSILSDTDLCKLMVLLQYAHVITIRKNFKRVELFLQFQVCNLCAYF
jgi:hypothetical protein